MSMSAVVEKWLQEKGWQFDIQRQQSRTTFEAEVANKNDSIKLKLCIDERCDFFAVYAYAPFKIAAQHHGDLLGIIARANWGHEFARFELNPDSGGFRCASSTVLHNSKLSKEMVERMAMFVMNWLDPFVPSLKQMAVSE